MSSYDDYDFGDGPGSRKKPATGWRRYSTTIYTIAGLVGVIVLTAAIIPEKSKGPIRPQQQSIVQIAPPVAPPPPPPPPPPVEQEMIEQKEVEEVEDDPTDAPPEASAVAKGTGGPNFGVKKPTAKRQMMVGGSKLGAWDKYALKIQSTLSGVLRNNAAINRKSLTVDVRIWVDRTGRITKASLTRPTGDPSVDAALNGSALVGTMLSEPPPADMVMPINLEIKATRPNS